MTLKQELQHILKGEVKDSPKVLSEYSRDASLFEVKPRVVVFPKDVEDIKILVKFVSERKNEGLSLVARSAGTDMTGGPLGESIVVDFTKHFKEILDIGEDWVRTQPGVYYRDFERKLASHNLLLPSYPASKDICTVGGMVANNSGGEKTLRYGKTEDYIKELKVVLADGEEYVVKPLSFEELQDKLQLDTFEGQWYRKLFKLVESNREVLYRAKPDVSKNSAGYYLWNVWDGKTFDATKLFAGSQGTLGLITEITFRLVKPTHHASLLVVFLYDFKPLAKLTNALLAHKPESLESYDDHTLWFAITHIPDFIKLLKGNSITLALQFIPEFVMFLKGGFKLPKLVVLAEFTGDSEKEITEKARAAQADLAEFHVQTRIARSDKEELKYMTVRRQSFNLLRHHVKGKRTAPFIDDLIVRPDDLPEFFPHLQRILKQYPSLIYTVAGHVGDGNFHIIPLMDLREEKNRKIIPRLMEEVHELVFKFKGSMTAEHNDGLIRTPFLEDMYGERVVSLFEDTKDIFDPGGIFNPGKKVRGDKAYVFSHIAKENKLGE